MATTFVVCIDGTWNAPGQTDLDPVTKDEAKTETNVAKTWQAITGKKLNAQRPYGTIASVESQQVTAIYLNGVGSSGTKIEKTIDGATGTGTSERIRDAYRFLAERWEEGDRIFGFGFSRGAFAIRSLFGFIELIGLPRYPSLIKEDELLNLYRGYQTQNNLARPRWAKSCKIDFLGLWDTVGALSFGNSINNFHRLNPRNVAHVCHALALDEQRKQFHPELFASQNNDQLLEEVWFAGAHTNIGGGYIDANLSNIALFWILHKAHQAGLRLRLAEVTGWYAESINGIRRPSYDEFWGRIPIVGAMIENARLFQTARTIPDNHRIHESVFEAMQHGYTPIAAKSGKPLNSAVEPWGI